METVHLYFMPGMAANSKIFEHLEFPETYQLHYLEWLDPLKNESLLEYSTRVSQLITHENPILIGVSFGGILVQEIKKLINVRKTIIISSVKSKNEFSTFLKISNYLRLYKIIPPIINHLLEPSLKFYFGKKSAKHLYLYNYFLTKRDDNYLNWALKTVATWDRSLIDKQVYHIHGNKDEIFSIKYIKNCNIVQNGTHIMIINKAKTLSKIIQDVIENEN